MADAEQKLSLGEKLGYGVGDAAANFVLQMRLAFLTYFYTDVYLIAPRTVAVIQLLSHVVDACNDMVMGALSDRTQTRWGKFRPWILGSAIPLGVAAYLIFAGPQFSPFGKVVYAAGTLVLMIIAYGANNIPYSALGGVISDDPDERVSVASWRMIFAMLAAFFVLSFSSNMVDSFGQGDELVGFRRTAAVWGLLAIMCSVATFLMTRERIHVAADTTKSLLRDLKVLVANPAWRVLAGASILIYIALGMRTSATIYYCEYVLRREFFYGTMKLFGAFNATSMVAAMIGIFFSRSLTERHGKRNTCCGGLVASAVLVALFSLLPDGLIWPAFALQFAFQACFGAVMPVIWGMIADVADLTEWRSGRRLTALTFAATMFFFKIGQGLGMGLMATLLEVAGYKPDVAQTPAALSAINTMMGILPAGLLLLSSLVMLRYVITQAMEQEMTAALRERREQLSEPRTALGERET
jgi:sugar (glycoside-pentoside-hexuronide) transporter